MASKIKENIKELKWNCPAENANYVSGWIVAITEVEHMLNRHEFTDDEISAVMWILDCNDDKIDKELVGKVWDLLTSFEKSE